MENVDFGNLKPYLITEADATDVLNFIFADFLLNEPHSAAIELESKDAAPIFEGLLLHLLLLYFYEQATALVNLTSVLVTKLIFLTGFIKAAIKSKISYALRDQNMEVVAVRLSYIVHRPTPVNFVAFSKKCLLLLILLRKLHMTEIHKLKKCFLF